MILTISIAGVSIGRREAGGIPAVGDAVCAAQELPDEACDAHADAGPDRLLQGAPRRRHRLPSKYHCLTHGPQTYVLRPWQVSVNLGYSFNLHT